MRTAEQQRARGQPTPAPRAPDARRGRRLAWTALALILASGLWLRLWGVGEGLPYVYNIDEADHFVPHAVRMFEQGTLNPHYFANPPAFTYLLHFAFAIAYGGASGAAQHFALHPAGMYELARVLAALLGTLSLWLLYLTGARLFGRGVGLLAAAIEAVAFLPVFYGHLALNDVPTLAPLTASLLGSAGILRKGRARDYLLAGAGLGLACATKYTAGIALVPLLAAATVRFKESEERARARALARGLALAGATALGAFVIANPYALLDYSGFHAQLVHQSSLSAEAQGKLGAPHGGGFAYYLWSFTWGLGWAPTLAAVGGIVVLWRADARAWLMLVPAVVVFLAFMGLQGRYFGRWLLPIFPIACVLAAFFASWLVAALARRLERGGARPRSLRVALAAAVAVVLLAQGAVYSVHSGAVMASADTRNATRAWMLAHVPRGAGIVAEPVVLQDWFIQPGAPGGRAWRTYRTLQKRITADGALEPTSTAEVGIEDYERTLAPALLAYYRANGYCWVLTGSTESGRAFADPRAVPQAIAYYRALQREGEVAYRASPYSAGARAVAFGFDWSFDYYPLAYARPGPVVTVYRLHGGRCGIA